MQVHDSLSNGGRLANSCRLAVGHNHNRSRHISSGLRAHQAPKTNALPEYQAAPSMRFRRAGRCNKAISLPTMSVGYLAGDKTSETPPMPAKKARKGMPRRPILHQCAAHVIELALAAAADRNLGG